ncbi:MAG: tetratricopeptide repeat protein [Gammaproteobacteria bacterium]|nr:tetratricopeptide repeat protein [Gammaproteobacteria bacterium]
MRGLGLALAAALLVACEAPPPGAGVSGQQPAVPALPDLAGVDAPVREQLLAVHATAEQRLSDPAAPAMERARALADLGMHLEAYGYGARAASCYAGATALNAAEPRWWFHRAWLAYRLGDDVGAQDALARLPGDEGAARLRGELALRRGDLEDAATAFASVPAGSGHGAGARLGQARVALERGQYARAEALLVPLARDHPREPAVQQSLGLALRGLGKRDAARDHLMRARGPSTSGTLPLWQDPRSAAVDALRQGASAHDRAALQALLRGDRDGAVAAYRRALAIDADSSDFRYNLGLLLLRGGQPEDGVAELQENLRRHPGHVATHLSLAFHYAGTGDFAAAESHIRNALAADPGSVRARLTLAEFLAFRDRPAEAIPAFESALALDATQEKGQVGLALALIREGRFSHALPALEAGLSALPRSYPLGVLYQRLLAAAPDAALRKPDRVVRALLPSGAALLTVNQAETLAMALARLEKFDEAVRWQAAVLAVIPEGAPERGRVQARLETYRAGRVVKKAWLVDEAFSGVKIRNPDG